MWYPSLTCKPLPFSPLFLLFIFSLYTFCTFCAHFKILRYYVSPHFFSVFSFFQVPKDASPSSEIPSSVMLSSSKSIEGFLRFCDTVFDCEPLQTLGSRFPLPSHPLLPFPICSHTLSSWHFNCPVLKFLP